MEDGSFNAIYQHWFADVQRWVRAFGTRPADESDVVQDVFLIVHRRLASFDGQNLAGWLYRIARRRARDYRASAWVRVRLSHADVDEWDRQLESQPLPLDEIERRETQRYVSQLLAVLSPKLLAVFVMFELEGRSGQDIARLQQLSLNAVWSRLFLARQKLKQEATRLQKLSTDEELASVSRAVCSRSCTPHSLY